MANCEKCVFCKNRLLLHPECVNKSVSKTQFERAYNSVLSCPWFCRISRLIAARGGYSKYETD